MALLDRDPDHPAAARFDDIAADDRVFGPIGPFDERIRLKRVDQIVRRVLVEHDHAVHAGKRLEDFNSLGLGRNRPPWAFDGANRSIGVDADNQRITQAAGALQVADVAWVKKIEYAVGEHDLLCIGTQSLDEGNRFSLCHG
jgi:hypothetical protein